MRLRPFVSLLPALLCSIAAAQEGPHFFSVPSIDAPELAARGPWPVGVRTINIVNPNQIDILHFDKATGKAPSYDRPLTIEVWYPAILPSGKEERVVYESAMPVPPPPGVSKTFQVHGKALRDAPPAAGQQFPLVVGLTAIQALALSSRT